MEQHQPDTYRSQRIRIPALHVPLPIFRRTSSSSTSVSRTAKTPRSPLPLNRTRSGHTTVRSSIERGSKVSSHRTSQDTSNQSQSHSRRISRQSSDKQKREYSPTPSVGEKYEVSMEYVKVGLGFTFILIFSF